MPDPIFHAAAAYDAGYALEKVKVKIDIFEFFGSNIFVNKSQAVRQNSN